MVKGRILALTSNYPRWAGDSTTPFVLHLSQNLQKIGWQVDVLAPHAHGAARKEVLGGVQVERFQYLWPSSLQTVCYQGGAMGNLRKSKANYIKLPLLLFFEWLSLCRKLSSGNYDLLHSHWILPQGFIGALGMPKGKRSKAIPHIVTVHGGDIFGLRGKLFRHAKTFALRHANGITVNSSVTEQAVRELVPEASLLKRIPMGVKRQEPMERSSGKVLELRCRYNEKGLPFLVYVGRVVEEKGVADLLAAVKMLKADSLDVQVLIVGEGQDRTRMEQLVGDLGIENNVCFTGWQPSDLVPYFMAAADIFIGPSRVAENGWVEAQGLTFIEAMMVGTPVIASRVGGIVDSVRHEDTGLLVDERSPAQIVQAVKRLLADRTLSERLRINGRKMAEANFTQEASAQAFDLLFSQVLQCRS